jgi:superfamily I DNA/RNA helicase
MHNPTPEQQAIIDAAVNTEDNILISALAGAAKTSTLEMIADALPQKAALCCAFNKKIADELNARLPSGYEAKTLNALGHAAWRDKIGKRPRVNKSKMYGILTEICTELETEDPKLAEELRESFGQLLREMRMAKAGGHIPDRFHETVKSAKKRLMTDDDLYNELEEELSADAFAVVLKCLHRSCVAAMDGDIDFDDQILMPAIFGGLFPRYKLVLVDEVQDLSELNHMMLDRLVRKRIIAVGDQCQAIYAFRGAYEDGMEQLKARFDMTEMHLSISFRCPETIVGHVQWRAPHMQHWTSNPNNPGTIAHAAVWEGSDIPRDAAVICRNNAPLLALAFRLLGEGIYPKIWGNDIAAGLINQIEKLGPKNMSQQQLLEAIVDWHDKKEKKVRNKSLLRDKTECLRIIARQGDTLGEAVAAAKEMFNSHGTIHLMTGHKAKGHEFNEVYVLDEHLIKDEGQDLNLRYVICTRAQRHLTYIKSDGWFNPEMETL